MSDVIDFTAKRGRKFFRNWQAIQAEKAQYLAAEDTPDHYIKCLRSLDAGEHHLFSGAADCIEELLGQLHEAERQLEEVTTKNGDLLCELADMEIAMGELEFESTTWRHELEE
jgi:hypothetical protein